MVRRNIRCSNCLDFSKALNQCLNKEWSCPHSDPVADIIKTYSNCMDCSGIFDIEDKNEFDSWTYTCIDCGTQYIHNPKREVSKSSLLNLIVKKKGDSQ